MYKGVLLKIRKIKIVGDLGRIHDEYPYVFVDVLYKILVFRPEKGIALCNYFTILKIKTYLSSWHYNSDFSLPYW